MPLRNSSSGSGDGVAPSNDEGGAENDYIESSRSSVPSFGAAADGDDNGVGMRSVGRFRGSGGDEDRTNAGESTSSNGLPDLGRGGGSKNDTSELFSPESDANDDVDERPSDGEAIAGDGDRSDVVECDTTTPPASDGKERNGLEPNSPPVLSSSASNGLGTADSRTPGGELRIRNKRSGPDVQPIEVKPGGSAHATFVSRYDASFVSGEERCSLRPRHGRVPRQWLYDRCDGVSKYEEKPVKRCPASHRKRPPCRICWPPVPLKWCPDLVEQNCWCEHIGKQGCVKSEDRQSRLGLLSMALACNVAGLLLLCVCAVSMTEERFDILWAVPFTHVWVHFHLAERDINGTAAEYAVGLRAVALRHLENNQTDSVISFSEFCDLPFAGSGMYTRAIVLREGRKRGGDCNACADTSKRIIPSLFLGMFSYLPTFITDINRMWATYDVNCQKFMASVFSWISLATSIYTWVNYSKNCFDYLNARGTAYLDKGLQPVPPGSEDVFIAFTTTYHAGLGQICLGLATFLKIIDIACNIMVPTPTITRDHLEQVEYDWKYGPHSDEDEEDVGGGVGGRSMRDDDDAVHPCKASIPTEADGEGGGRELVVGRWPKGDRKDTERLSGSCQTNT